MGFEIKLSFDEDARKEQDFSVERIAFLNILQGIISRLANTATAVKVASVTVLSAILAFSVTGSNTFEWWGFIPASVFFMYFHAYFLQQERAFVKLYNIEAQKKRDVPVDFVVDAKKLESVTEGIFFVLKRKTIFCFHIILCIGFIVIYLFSKKQGVENLCLRMYV